MAFFSLFLHIFDKTKAVQCAIFYPVNIYKFHFKKPYRVNINTFSRTNPFCIKNATYELFTLRAFNLMSF